MVRRWHKVGSTCSRHWAHKLLAGDFLPLGPTNRLSKASLSARLLTIGLQLLPLINPIIFEPNNHNISVFGLWGFTWVSSGLLNSAEMPHNKPKWLIGRHIGYFSRLDLMGWSCEYFNQAQIINGGPFKCGFKKWAYTDLIFHWFGYHCTPYVESCKCK